MKGKKLTDNEWQEICLFLLEHYKNEVLEWGAIAAAAQKFNHP
jgi:hypothetical protein